MRYTFLIKKEEDKIPGIDLKIEGMSFKKVFKSLINQDSKWSGTIRYLNKKRRDIIHTIKNGKKI
jgi:hypothetical protein